MTKNSLNIMVTKLIIEHQLLFADLSRNLKTSLYLANTNRKERSAAGWKEKSTSYRNRIKRPRCGSLTGDVEGGRAAVGAVMVGCLAAVFTAVRLCGAQKLQRGDIEAADDPAFIPIFNRLSFLEPFEVDIWGILSLTFKLGVVSSIDLQGHYSVPEHRFH